MPHPLIDSARFERIVSESVIKINYVEKKRIRL